NVDDVDSRVIICDGKAIFATRFSKLIMPRGAEADVWELDEKDRGPIHAEFQFDPSDLAGSFFALDLVLKHYGSSLVMEKLPGGGCTGKYSIGEDCTSVFEATPETGMNIGTNRGYLKNGTFFYQDNRATWEQSGNVWYIKAIELNSNDFDGTRHRTRFAYESFEPNAKVPEELFSAAALELPPGSRILDRLPGAGGATHKIPTVEAERTVPGPQPPDGRPDSDAASSLGRLVAAQAAAEPAQKPSRQPAMLYPLLIVFPTPTSRATGQVRGSSR